MTATSPRSVGSHRMGGTALALVMALLASGIPFGVVLAAEPAAAPSTPDLITGDTGSSDTDNITQTLNGLTFTGTAEAGTTVRIYGGAVEIGSGTTSGAGVYTITTTTALPDNTANLITAKAQHPAGVEGSPSGPLTVTTDNTAPASAPGTPDLTDASDTGTSNSDEITADTTPTFTGTSGASATVQLLADGLVVGTGVASGTNWTITSGTIAAGVHSFTAKQFDAAGNGPSAESAALSVEIDTNVPAAPTVPDLTAASDSGPSNTDNITSDTTPSFIGTAPSGTTVDLYAGAVLVGSAATDGSGNWAITSSALTAGTYSFTAKATDVVGTSAASPPLSVTIQTALAVTVNQAVGQPDPTATQPLNFVVVFSNPVTNFASGDVAVSGTAGGTKVVAVTGGPTTYNVGITGLTTAGTVIVDVAANVVSDAAGNDNTASTFTDRTVTWAPGAPTVTINQANTQADPTATSPINFTVVFSSAVTGFTGSEVVITGTAGGTKTVAVTGSGTTYNAAVSGMTTAGTVIANIPAGVATSGGVGNLVSTSTDNQVTWAPGAPTVTINQATGQADPTSATPINFTAVFSAAVTGFTGSDVVITGTAGGTKTVTVTGGPTTYNVAVSGMTTSGTVIATIPAGVALNASAQGNLASTSTDNTVTWTALTASITLTTSAPTPPGAKDPVILWGQGFTLGVQFGANGASKSFQLQGTRDLVTWTTIATLTTDAGGRASFFYTPVTNLYYRAVFAGTPDLGAANSNQVRTVVRELALLRPTNSGATRTINRNTSTTFTTTVRPARPELAPARVSFYFYRFSSGAWRQVAKRDVLIDSAGLARTTFRFTSSGQWYVRAQANPTPYNANSVMTPVERYSVR